MGESKRRKRALDTYRDEVLSASYVRARVVAVRGVEDDPADFHAIVEALAAAPGAIRSAAFADVGSIPVVGNEDPFADEIDTPFMYDPDSGTLAPVAQGGFEDGAGLWHPCLRCMTEGEPFELSASISGGFMEADGSPVADPVARMRGLARLGADDAVVAIADAPLLHQFLSIRNAILVEMALGSQGGTAALDAAGAHLRHLEALHRVALSAPDVGRDAWLDHSAFAYAVRDGILPADGEAYDPVHSQMDEIGVSLVDARRFPQERVAARLGPRLLASTLAWMRRDDAGSGIVFAEADRKFAKAGGEGVSASNLAEVLYLQAGREPEADSRVRAYLDGLERIGSHDGLTLRRDGDLLVGSWRTGGDLNVIVSPPDDGGPRPTDPLMTEGLDDVDLTAVDGAAPSPDDLAGLSFLGDLPDPATVGDYATFALAKAHAEGASLLDFCATFASLMRWPADGVALEYILDDIEEDEGFVEGTAEGDAGIARLRAANASAADRLAMLGGVVRPRLAALVGPLFADGYRPEAEGDARLLADAVRRGGTLPELALACMLHEPED